MNQNQPDDMPTRIGDVRGEQSLPNDENVTVPSGRFGAPDPDAEATVPTWHPEQTRNPAHMLPARPVDPLLGTQLGGCRIESLLGRGAMGAVYRARQTRLDREVAVKVIRPEMLTDPRTLKRFEVEAKTVGRFNSEHVVMVHDVGFESDVHFLVMELVHGGNLREHAKLLPGGRLPVAEAIVLLRQACKGLQEAQRLGVIHRDIKPDNLMLTDRGILKIADFGIAKPVEDDLGMTRTAELIGTPLYMSPEQCEGAEDLDFRSDMYSLGATFYYLLTGEPPCRASSIYELLQTKTKIEHLCLWKALPELAESHPLSRVIERMTALDREDRYPSYDALVGDIGLVESGQTIDRYVPVRESAPARGKAAGAARRVAWAVGVLVLAAAGGGYWWSTRGDASAAPAAAGRLGELRAQLSSQGPTEPLRAELAALRVEPAQNAEREQMLADVEQGLAAKVRLDDIVVPASLEPPFADLEAHFAAVDAAVASEGTPGKEVRQWLDSARTDARAERALGATAQASLLAAFTAWQTDRSKAAGDEQKIAQLGERLQTIEDGRRKLTTLLPNLVVVLDEQLPVATLDDARRKLFEKPTRVEEVDAGSALEAIRSEFERSGPVDSLVERTKGLAPTLVEQQKAKEQLLNAFQVAKDCKREADSAHARQYPADPKLPFDDIATYYETVDRALAPLKDAQRGLPEWAARRLAELRDEQVLQARVLDRCRQSAEPPGPADLEDLARGITLGSQWFPAIAAELALLAPKVEQLRSGRNSAQRRGQLLAAVQDLSRRLQMVRTVVDWRAQRERLGADLDARRKAAVDFAGDAELQLELRGVSDVAGRWAAAEEKVSDLAAQIAGGNLSGAADPARSSVNGVEGRDELRALADAAAKCSLAFDRLERSLDTSGAVALLGEARSAMEPFATLVSDADSRVQRWVVAIESLQRAARGMVAIPAGSVDGGKVASFFMSATEIARGEFAKFLADLRTAAADKQGAERLAAVAPRLSGLPLTETQLDELLQIAVKSQLPRVPADRLTWLAAAAFAAWHGCSLPAMDEWKLAALGDGTPNRFPWGGKTWDYDAEHRNPSTDTLVEVDAGGLCWRVRDGVRIHHLAGNVSEWLQSDPESSTAELAGGRYSDAKARAEEQAAGRPVIADKVDGQRGFGARTILRPRSFPGLDWPR